MQIKRRNTCRVCGSSSLSPVIDLGEQYLQGSFIKEGREMPPMEKIPCRIIRCDPQTDETACGLLQMEHTVPPEILYSEYWYRSGTNNTMRSHLRGIADEATALWDAKEAVVLDIGCNDGTLLGNYPPGFTKYGIDPSDVASEVTGENIQVVQDVFPSKKLDTVLDGRKVNIITSIAMFYDLEDPVGFAQNIKHLLSHDGIWIFEMSYMPQMLRLNSYDTICHEHLEYYSLSAIENILQHAGLRLFKIGFNDINGGSIRCYATRAENHTYDSVEAHACLDRIRREEFDMALDTDGPYLDFQSRIEGEKEKLHSTITDLRRREKRIHIYGASTKGNTILQFCGLDNSLIDYAAERNPDKYGARTLGTNIPIIREAESRAMKPDYYLVLPWHFKAEFLEREREMLAAGVGFIFPLPEIEIVKE